MQGAKLAEKIQEFYHTTTVPGVFSNAGHTLGAKSNGGMAGNRADLHSQGGARGSSKMQLVGDQNIIKQ